MNFKHAFLFLLILFSVGFLFPIPVQAAYEGPVCGSETPCDKQGKAFAGSVAMLAAFIGPHLLLVGGSPSKDQMFYGGFGIGNHDGKKLSLDAKSFWSQDRQWMLATAGEVEIFTKHIPSRLVTFFPRIMTRVGAGLTHDFSKTHIPLIPDSRIGFLISHEDDPFLMQKTTFLSILAGI